jgi:hypothetical protein
LIDEPLIHERGGKPPLSLWRTDEKLSKYALGRSFRGERIDTHGISRHAGIPLCAYRLFILIDWRTDDELQT